MTTRQGSAEPDDLVPNRRAQVLVALYPPAWRARYASEFTALLADTGVGPRQAADVVRAAALAWARPATRLHSRAGRMRATVGVTLCAWSALAAGAVLFAKLTRDGALYLTDRAHPVVGWWYDAFALGAWLSALAMTAGGLPLAARMLHTARQRTRRDRVMALLAVPPMAVLTFLGIAGAVARLAAPAQQSGTDGVGPGWFLVLTGVGLAAAAACAAGPATALHRVRPDGPALTIAVVAGSCATALMTAATAASLAFALARPPERPSAGMLTAYGVAMAAALLTAATSCARGLRAAWPSAQAGDSSPRTRRRWGPTRRWR